MRTRWPERFSSLRFVAIHPDPDLASRLTAFHRSGRRTKVLVAELDAAMAANITADLRALLPASPYDRRQIVGPPPRGTPATAPILYSPRAWLALSPAERADERAIEIRYLIEPKDLAALGEESGWTPRSHTGRARPRQAPVTASSA